MTDNLAATLDRVLDLYIPLVDRWMSENPAFAAIETCIGRDEPVAWPTASDGMGYSDEAFEESAAASLLALEAQTATILAKSPILQDIDEPLDLFAFRDGSEITVTASASNGLGSVVVSRSATRRHSEPFYVFSPCTMSITSVIESDDLRSEVEDLQGTSLGDIAEFNIRHSATLNLPGERAAVLREWIAAFPDASPVTIEKIGRTVFKAIAATLGKSAKLCVRD